ncbi:MAG: signal recognition particle protein [Candidatus Aureabacteria bacterium]|nr:signal recognition particle protein [Candidatus Auribacterota bacterium]
MFDSISERFQGIFKDIRGMGKITDKNIQEPLREVRKALLEADVNYKVVKKFMASVKEKSLGEKVLTSITPGQKIVKIIYDEMVSLMDQEKGEIDIKSGFSSLMLVGLQGSGKTTTAGKLSSYFKKNDLSTMLVAADTKRLAARQQLKTIADQVGSDFFTIEDEVNPVLIINAAKETAQKKGIRRLIVDTAGRLHVENELMEELASIQKNLIPDEVLFVADATTGQDAVNICKEFNSFLTLSGIILTKMDGDARGGAAMSIAYTTGKTIKFVGIGEKLGDFEPFYPDRMASRILGMGDIVGLVEKAQSTFDEKTAIKMEEKFRKNEFDLNDFLQSLRQIKKMGPLEGLLKMIPGAANMGKLSIDEKEILHVEALMSSMTMEERMKPDVIDSSRKKRISHGAGRSVQELNSLLKRFLMMKKMMKNMGKFGKKFKMPAFPG